MATGFTQPVTEMSTERFLGARRGLRVRLTTLPPCKRRLSRQRGILDISQLHRPPRPAAGIALLFCVCCVLCVQCVLYCLCCFLWCDILCDKRMEDKDEGGWIMLEWI
jgi:hypothetical protein